MASIIGKLMIDMLMESAHHLDVSYKQYIVIMVNGFVYIAKCIFFAEYHVFLFNIYQTKGFSHI